MNKAFVKEPDHTGEYCPRCGAEGEPVTAATLAARLAPGDRTKLAAAANFCPTPTCEAAYFDGFERVILATELPTPVYPKDPDAPLCACFGLTRADIERDVAEGVVTRVRAAVERAKSPEARCEQHAANGRNCVAYAQKYYFQCKASS